MWLQWWQLVTIICSVASMNSLLVSFSVKILLSVCWSLFWEFLFKVDNFCPLPCFQLPFHFCVAACITHWFHLGHPFGWDRTEQSILKRLRILLQSFWEAFSKHQVCFIFTVVMIQLSFHDLDSSFLLLASWSEFRYTHWCFSEIITWLNKVVCLFISKWCC